MTASKLREMSNTNIKDVDAAGLKNIESVMIDTEQDISARVQSFLSQIENPYCFLVGNTPVKISFSDRGKPLDNALLHYFLSLKQ